MDFFIDKTMQQIIKELCEQNNDVSIPTWRYWKATTKRMMRYLSVMQIIWVVTDLAAEISDEQWIAGYPKEIFNNFEKKQKEQWVAVKDKKRSKLSQAINEKLKITDVATKLGCKFNKKGDKIVCPFHADTEPSCSISDKYNNFKCWGCGAKGNLIQFIAMMKKLGGLKNGCN